MGSSLIGRVWHKQKMSGNEPRDDDPSIDSRRNESRKSLRNLREKNSKFKHDLIGQAGSQTI